MQNERIILGILNKDSGYGLVVEHVLAKDETGVRFSLPALGANKQKEPHGFFWF